MEKIEVQNSPENKSEDLKQKMEEAIKNAHSAEKEAKYLSILVVVVGIILIIHAFLPVNLYTKILMDVIITFLLASGISFWFRDKKRNK